MKNKNNLLPIISICIPVYNGEKLIHHTLKSIENSIKEIDSNYIEILISDNNSNDKTVNIINSYKKNGMNLNLILNNENLGYDNNLDVLAKNSKGTFIWFLGVGEIILKNSIKKLIFKIEQNIESQNFVLDFKIFSEKKNKITHNSVLNLNEDLVLIGKNNFQKNKYNLSVSGNVINREAWMKYIDKPLFSYGWNHIEKILWIISNDVESKTVLLKNQYFILFQDINGWWTDENSYKPLLEHLNLIDKMKEMEFSSKAIKTVKEKQLGFAILNSIIQSRKNGKKFTSNEISEFKKHSSLIFYYIIILPFNFLPIKFCDKILNVFLICKKILKAIIIKFILKQNLSKKLYYKSN